MTEFAIPSSWEWSTLGEISAVNPRITKPDELPDDVAVTFVPMAAVDEQLGQIVAPQIRPILEVWKGYTRFADNDVLFAKITPCMENGKIAIASGLQNGIGCGSTEFHVLRPSEAVISEWLYYYIRQQSYRDVAQRSMTGTAGQLRVPSKHVVASPIPLAPLNEQRRIVEVIEEQFSRLDAGVQALKRLQANLKRYKAAVLKAACEGKLVPQDPNDEPASELLARILDERKAKWEAEQLAKGKDPRKVKYPEPAAPDTEGLPELPDGWTWASLDQCSWDKSYGTSEKCDYAGDGIPVLRIPNVSKGRIDLEDLKFAIELRELSDDVLLMPNDLLIIRTNGSKSLIGRSALVRAHFENAYYFASYIIRFRLINVEGAPEWIAAIWDSELIRNWISRIAATSAGQYNVSSTSLARTPIPIPTTGYQAQVIVHLEFIQSVIEEMEHRITLQVKRAERLKQAILSRAFAGQLVPQDPNDEPASELLKRIQNERMR